MAMYKIDRIGGICMKRKKMPWNEKTTEDVYDEDYVEDLLEDDEISAEEEGFMVGYNQA